MSGTAFIKCTCKHEFQDKTYGPQRRVATVGIKEVTCTVCGKKHPKRGADKHENPKWKK